MRNAGLLVVTGVLLALGFLMAACGSSSQETPAATVEPTPSPSPAPRDPQAGEAAFHAFAAAVQAGSIEDAWALYAASVPGTTAEHRADRGCDFNTFSYEFPQIRYLFQQTAPFTVTETFGSALGINVVELYARGSNDTDYLVTLPRAEPYSQDYQLMFLNRGSPALVPGAPDPFPSPEYPQGFCGIWTGAR